jgi:4-amino-4-deoxy-L-arabinose transferase-like glycosyltransferase
MNFIQGTLQLVEVGKGQVLVRLVPLITALAIIAGLLDFSIYHGLADPQSMDNAQLARQLATNQGFTTKFLRPHAIAQMRDRAVTEGGDAGHSRELFPADLYPPGTPRILPDTYNPPGFPYLLSIFFKVVHPEFDQPVTQMLDKHMYSGDRLIPFLNQVFLLLTAILVFAIGRRLFDERVAWISMVAFLACDLVWRYSLTALSTSFLLFVLTAAFACVLEIVCIGEACFDREEISFAPAWIWAAAAAVFLGLACLTRLHLLVLLIPVVTVLFMMPRASYILPIVLALAVLAMTAPWFLHWYKVTGSIFGSNAPLLLSGEGEYNKNQIFCKMDIPSYEQLFRDASKKVFEGMRWHFENGWAQLGASPLVLFFVASALHQFKRRRTRLFHGLLFGCGLALVLVNSLGVSQPEPLGPWNVLILIMPCAIVVGAAFFFILLDRLSLQLWLLNHLIIGALIVVSMFPLLVTLLTTPGAFYAFPPYMPPLIKQLAQLAQPDEWVTTDMPWATAWYADRASLWLPDSVSDFENLHDNVCPTGMLIFTPVTWTSPVYDYSEQEYKDWYPLALVGQAPTNFPLAIHSTTPPGGPDYSLWSDRARWQAR